MARRSTGFTLMEVVIALAILAMAFFGMISVVTYTSRMNSSTKERNLAMRAAERKLEQILSYQDWATLYTNFGDLTAATGEGKGWEQVKELGSDGKTMPALPYFPMSANFVTQNLKMATGFQYAAALAPTDPTMVLAGVQRHATLFVRFPMAAGGGGTMSEVGAGTFANMATANLDLNADNDTLDTAVAVADCKILPIVIEVYWKPAVGDKATPGYLNLRYVLLRKT